MGRGFGITALIFGIISIPFTVVLGFLQMWIFFEPNLISIDIILGWLIPGIAIIFGIIGIILDSSKGMAIAGLILGIIGLFLGFLYRTFISDWLASIILIIP